jgi:hypothetical protein
MTSSGRSGSSCFQARSSTLQQAEEQLSATAALDTGTASSGKGSAWVMETSGTTYEMRH